MFGIILSYGIKNTSLFLIVGLFIYYLSYLYIVKYRKTRVDLRFVYSIIPLIFIGVIVRIMGDLGYLSAKYLQYPFLFGLLGVLYLLVFEVTRLISREHYIKHITIIGLILLLPFLIWFLFRITQWIYFIEIIISSFVLLIFFIFIYSRMKEFNMFKSRINKLFLFSEILDTFATSFALIFLGKRFVEEHFLSSFLISTNIILFVVIKLFITLLLLYLIDKLIKDEKVNHYLKLLIIILALSTGGRDLFLISVI